MNSLAQLRQHTTDFADTGNFKPLAVVASNPNQAVDEVVDEVVDEGLMRFGLEILKVVPGRVFTDVDARLRFDVAATWQGTQAARILESEGARGRAVDSVKLLALFEAELT